MEERGEGYQQCSYKAYATEINWNNENAFT